MPDTLVAARAPAPGSDFAPLARQVRASGLLDRRTGYYVRAITLNVLATVAVWVAVAAVGGSWWVLLLAVPAALLSARTGFLGHDAGHHQIARSSRVRRLLGLLLGNLMVGMSHGWWNDKHNRHHANPNHVGKDPDVAPGAIAWTADQAVGGRARRWLARHQGLLFFPLTTLESLSLKASSVRDLPNRPPGQRAVEATVLVVHIAGYLTLAFTLMPPGTAVAFIAIHQALFGLHLGCAFAPNHKGMPMPGPGERWGHLKRQVVTSRNIRGGLLTDWFLGGLNYQIEHHLFPSMPRPNLRHAQPMIRAHCAAAGLPYVETGLVESYVIALRYLDDVGNPSR